LYVLIFLLLNGTVQAVVPVYGTTSLSIGLSVHLSCFSIMSKQLTLSLKFSSHQQHHPWWWHQVQMRAAGVKEYCRTLNFGVFTVWKIAAKIYIRDPLFLWRCQGREVHKIFKGTRTTWVLQ